MKAIAITDAQWGIAKNGRQVFFIPEDLAFFRAQTLGNVVIMGRKTLGALPGGQPLAGRTNIILTHGAQLGSGQTLPQECIPATVETLPGLLRQYEGKEIYVAGGGEVYSLLLPYCEEALITRVLVDCAADTFFPNLDEINTWKITQKSEIKAYKNTNYQFLRYSNAKPVAFHTSHA